MVRLQFILRRVLTPNRIFWIYSILFFAGFSVFQASVFKAAWTSFSPFVVFITSLVCMAEGRFFSRGVERHCFELKEWRSGQGDSPPTFYGWVRFVCLCIMLFILFSYFTLFLLSDYDWNKFPWRGFFSLLLIVCYFGGLAIAAPLGVLPGRNEWIRSLFPLR